MTKTKKWLFTFLCFILVFVLGDFLPDEPLKSKAMVMAFGIDLEEDNTVSLHLQILSGKSSSSETGGNTRVLTEKASTIGETAYHLSRSTGLNITLTHCNVVILGEKLLKSRQVYSVLNYLTSNAYLSDNACIFACEGSPSVLLESKVAFGSNSGLYIREIIGQYDAYGDIPSKTLREFVVDYHSLGQTNWLPYITRTEVSPKVPASTADTSTPTTSDYLFDLTHVAILKKNIFLGIKDKNTSFVINCVLNKIDKGSIVCDKSENVKICWYILKNRSDIKYDEKEKTVHVKVTLKVLLKEVIDYSLTDENINQIETSEEEISCCEEQIKDLLSSTYLTMQALDADIFGWEEEFFCRFARDKSYHVPLNEIKTNFEVELQPS